MKLIKVEFLTKKGEEAYRDIENKPLSFKERWIDKQVCVKKIISKDPLKINFIIKMPNIAKALELDEKIIEVMSKYDCMRDLDYIMEVEE